jgi:hypothetical protein
VSDQLRRATWPERGTDLDAEYDLEKLLAHAR